ARLKYHSRVHVISHSVDRVDFRVRPGGPHRNVAQHRGVHTAHQVVAIHHLLTIRLAVADPNATLTTLDGGERSAEVNPFTQLCGKCVGQPLIATLNSVYNRVPEGYTAQLHNGRVPDHMQRGSFIPKILDRSGGGAILSQQIAEGDFIKVVKTG